MESDIDLIFANCEKYNIDDAPIISQAMELCEKLKNAIQSSQNQNTTSVFMNSSQSYNSTTALPSLPASLLLANTSSYSTEEKNQSQDQSIQQSVVEPTR